MYKAHINKIEAALQDLFSYSEAIIFVEADIDFQDEDPDEKYLIEACVSSWCDFYAKIECVPSAMLESFGELVECDS